MRIKWPIPHHTQLELVALIALQKLDPDLSCSEAIHSARVAVPGLKSLREVDVLYCTGANDRRISVEAQKRGRKITQPFLDQVEGKMTQISAAQTIIVSDAGFSRDVITRVRNANGRLRAVRFAHEDMTVQATLENAKLELQLTNGASATIDLVRVSILDSMRGMLGYSMYGLSHPLRTMAVVITRADIVMPDASSSILILDNGLKEASVENVLLRIPCGGRELEQTPWALQREFALSTGARIE